MTEEEITPEYIVSQISILTEAELLELITEYGNEQYSNGSYWASKDSY